MKHKLVDFIIQFMEEVDKEISEMKLFVCTLVGGVDSTDIRVVECAGAVRGRGVFNTGETCFYPNRFAMLTKYCSSIERVDFMMARDPGSMNIDDG